MKEFPAVNSIGLMLGSDYGYATSGDSLANRNKCLQENQSIWNAVVEDTYAYCKDNNWIYNEMPNETSSWLILKSNNTTGAHRIMKNFTWGYDGPLTNNVVIIAYRIYPTLYFKPSVNIV